MARYAVFAADELYGGLHGMNSTFVTEAESDREIEWIARDESLDIIDSYMCIRDDLYDVIQVELVYLTKWLIHNTHICVLYNLLLII